MELDPFSSCLEIWFTVQTFTISELSSVLDQEVNACMELVCLWILVVCVVVCMYTSFTTGNPLSISSLLVVKRSLCLCKSALFEQYAVLHHLLHSIHYRCINRGEERKRGNSSNVCLCFWPNRTSSTLVCTW